MVKKSEKIKNQLLIALSLFTLTGVAIALVSLFFFRKIHDIHKVSAAVHKVYQDYIKVTKDEENFIHLETSKTHFFKTGSSQYLSDFKMHYQNTLQEIVNLKNAKLYYDFEIDRDIDKVKSELAKYETYFNFIVEKVKLKGFKDYGIEGKMRTYVHNLESKSSQIGLANVLMLRRHEKDFIIRNDDSYITKLDKKADAIKTRIWKNNTLSNIQKDTLMMLLQNYKYSFHELAGVTKEIGYKDGRGLSENLLHSKNLLDEEFRIIHETIITKEIGLIKDIEKVFLIIILNIIAVSSFIIYLYTRQLRKNNYQFSSEHVILSKKDKMEVSTAY